MLALLVAASPRAESVAGPSISVTIEGSLGQAGALQCVDKKLRFLSPIPGLARKNITDGQAVAVILEAPEFEPEILSGISERFESTFKSSSIVDPSRLPISALLKDRPVTVARLGDTIVLGSIAKSRELSSFVRDCRGVVPTSISSTRMIEVKADLELDGEKRWIVLASRPTADEAFQFADNFTGRVKNLQVIKTGSGVYAVISGPRQVGSKGSEIKSALIREGAPSDLYFSQGKNYVAKIERDSERVCKVTGTPGNELNVRDQPNGTVVGKLTENQVVSVGDRRETESGDVWLNIRTASQLSGWASGKFIQCS